MHLTDLVSALKPLQYRIVKDYKVADIKQDSRTVCKGDIFVAINGSQVDGHRYIKSTIPKQPSAFIVSSSYPVSSFPMDVSFFQVKDTSKAWSLLAQAFYDYPSTKLSMVAITGTTGKTTTAHIVSQMLTNLGQKNMVIGTGGVLIGGDPLPYVMKGPVTTPEPKELQYLLQVAVKEECRFVVLEASSHGLDQERLYGVEFDVAIFATLAECHHVSYHGSLQSYIRAKEKLFKLLKKNGIILINKDTPLYSMLDESNSNHAVTYSMQSNASYTLIPIEYEGGKMIQIDGEKTHLKIPVPLTGQFQLYNFTAAALTAKHFGFDPFAIEKALQSIQKIPGRRDYLQSSLSFTVLVDKANVPLALEYIKKEIQGEHYSSSILVFGNVGGGEKETRAYLGSFFSTFFDTIVLTKDDPETEDPSIGYADFMSKMTDREKEKVTLIPDRKSAIQYALHLAKEKSIVAILGRGNQREFLEKGKTTIFDDIEETEAILRKMEEEMNER